MGAEGVREWHSQGAQSAHEWHSRGGPACIYIYIYTYAVFVIYIYTVELPRFSGGGDLYDWHWLFEEAQPNAAWVVTQQIWYFLFPELCLERDGEGVVRLRQDRRWARPLRSPDIDESDSESPQ